MTKKSELSALYARKQRLERNGKNLDSRGVIRKIERQIRNLSK